jgi:hypothetical protein
LGSVKYLKNELIFCLPPLDEQKTILEKVENLMQAVLKEAFQGKKEEVVI